MKMDSEMLFKITNFLRHKVEWLDNAEDGWVRFGQGHQRKWDLVESTLSEQFPSQDVYILRGRTNSNLEPSESLHVRLKTLAGKEDFMLWNKDMNIIMEFSSIGMMRMGKLNKKL
ncbi:MAG: hypothetical protein P8O20_03970 [Bacteroidia bacterium]|jgi:hypothetical protein|nr:hypothetical protein [Bacteroidia bacterium]